jgi:L-rhamnose mutarotase
MPRKLVGMTLDVKPEGYQEYKKHHEKVWPQVEQALKEAGLCNLSIFALGTV